MRLVTRLARIETKLQAEDEVPGAVIDPTAVDPRTPVIRFRLRPDGPQ